MAPRCWVFSSPFLAEGAAGIRVVRVVDVVVLLWCFVLLGWWGPLVDVDDAPGDVDAVGVMVCGVAVSTLGWGPGGWRWWRLFASRAGVLGVAVGGGALGVTLCRGRGGGGRGVVGDGTSVRRWWGWRGVDIAVGVGGVGVADGEGVTVVVAVSRGGLMAWVLLVLVLGAACVWVVGGSGRATRGWWLVGLWSWWCRLSLVLGYFLRLSLGL